MSKKQSPKDNEKYGKRNPAAKTTEKALNAEAFKGDATDEPQDNKGAWNMAFIWFGIPLFIVILLAFLLKD